MAASVAHAQEAGERINLICVGSGTTEEPTSARVRGYDSNGDWKVGTVTGSQIVGFEDQVRLWIEGGNGQIRMPRAMLPSLRGGVDGWFEIRRIQVGDDEIVGSIAVNFMNKPKLRLDRISGAISISGRLGDFTGRCEKFDPETAERAF